MTVEIEMKDGINEKFIFENCWAIKNIEKVTLELYINIEEFKYIKKTFFTKYVKNVKILKI